MKPWEETWDQDGERVDLCDPRDGAVVLGCLAVFGTPVTVQEYAPGDDVARAELAAAAPELYRALEGVRVLIAATPHLGLCLVHEGQPCTCGMDSKRAAIEAALRKARGET